MPAISSLVKQLANDFPAIHFVKADDFLWSPDTKTVSYTPGHPDADALLLHELGHALLDHNDYRRDVELLRLENDAWQKARELSITYDIAIAPDTQEDHLDTYRDWMHARSLCPSCGATGQQSDTAHYSCIACTGKWKVNEARVCSLRRYSVA